MNDTQKAGMTVLKETLSSFLEDTLKQKDIIDNLIKTLAADPDSVAISATKLLECSAKYMDDVAEYSTGDPDAMLEHMCGVSGTIHLLEVMRDEVAKVLKEEELADGS